MQRDCNSGAEQCREMAMAMQSGAERWEQRCRAVQSDCNSGAERCREMATAVQRDDNHGAAKALGQPKDRRVRGQREDR